MYKHKIGAYAIAVSVLIFDQASKWIIESWLQLGQSVAVSPFFNLTLVYNPGAAFSFLADQSGWQRWFLAAVVGVISTVLIFFIWRLKLSEKWTGYALGLILGGGLGNLYDRMAYGHVVDFIDIYYSIYHFPTFNIADSAVCIGAGLLILLSIHEWTEAAKDNVT